MSPEPSGPQRRRTADEESDRVIPLHDVVASNRVRTVLATSASIDARRRRVAEQAAAARLSQKALRDTSLAELLEDAVFTLADTLAVEQATVLLFDDTDSESLVLAAGFGAVAAKVGTLRVPTVGSVGGLALTRREPVTAHAATDRYRFPASRPLFEAGVESSIVVPIEGPDHAFGVLAAHAYHWRSFTRDDELFLQTVANVVGAAVLRDRAELTLIEAEEAERRRIAEAVHDDTLQVMIAVALRLESLERQAADDGLKARIHELVADTRDAAGRLRSLAFDLFPEDLGSGLEAVVGRLLADAAADCGFTFALTADLTTAPPQAAARTLYRNAQEAIVNIRKHAHASHVEVALGREGEGTWVRIADDGIGISPRAAATGVRGHLGIRGLRDRALRCGGRLHIAPGPDGGTVVEFWIPDAPRRPGR